MQFLCKILAIYQTLLLRTSHVLHTQPSLRISLCSCYVWWSSCSHILYHLSSAFGLHDCWAKCCHLIIVIITTMWRKRYYAKAGIPMGTALLCWENKCHWWSGLSDDIINSRVLNKLKVLIQDNRWITVTSTANKFGIRFGTLYSSLPWQPRISQNLSTEEPACWQKEPFCIITTSNLVLQQWLFRWFEN